MLWGSITGLLSLWCFSEVFIKSTPDFWTALIWFRPVLVAGGLIPPLLLNFSLEFPRRHPLIKKKMNRFLFYMLVYLPNIFLLLRAEYMSFFVNVGPIPATVWGNAFTRDFFIRLVAKDVFIPHYVFLFGMIFIGFYFIFKNLENAKNNLEKKQMGMIVWALTLLFIPSLLLDGILSIIYSIYTEVFPIFTSILTVITAYAMMKYKFLIISPATEDLTMEFEEGEDVEPGFGYVVPETARRKGMNMVLSALAKKRDGIIITNKDPMDVRVDYGIKRTPIIYMGEKTNYEMRIDPGDLDGLVSSLSAFTMMTKNPVLVVDWDNPVPGRVRKKGRSGKRDTRDLAGAPFSEWFRGDNLEETIDGLVSMLAGGSSIIIFQDMTGTDIVRSRRPLQHIGIINFFTIEKLLGKICDLIEKAEGPAEMFLRELAGVDKFFEGWMRMEGALKGPVDKVSLLDRRTTVEKLRSVNLALSRSTTKGAQEALKNVWTPSNLRGYSIEEISMPEGAINFLVGEEQAYTFGVLKEFVAAGFDGLCISTRAPDKIRALYGLNDVEYRWITTSDTDDKRAIPVSLEHIRRDIRAYIEKHNEGVVLLDGIELLVSRLGFENVQRFLHVIKDELPETLARLIISIHPKAIDEQRLTLMRREVEI